MEFYGQKNIKGQLPILIGSIPLRSVFRDFVNLKKRDGADSEDNRKPFGLSMGYPDLRKSKLVLQWTPANVNLKGPT